MPTKDTRRRIEETEHGTHAAGVARPRRGAVTVDGLPWGVRKRLSNGLIDELLAGARTEEEIVGPGGLLADLTRLWSRARSAPS